MISKASRTELQIYRKDNLGVILFNLEICLYILFTVFYPQSVYITIGAMIFKKEIEVFQYSSMNN